MWRQRFKCLVLDCGHRWSYTKNAQPHTSREQKNICRDSIERGSVRILGRRFEKSKSAVMNIVHRVTKDVKGSLWVAENFKLSWSGILVFDGVNIRVYDKSVTQFDLSKLTNLEKRNLHKKVWLCGIDYLTGDLPHYDLGDEETMVDLVMYFQTLKKTGYELRVLVSDGNESIIRAARHVFGNQVLHQLCTRHFVEGLRDMVGGDRMLADTNLGALIDRIQRVIEAGTLEESGTYYAELKMRPLHNDLQRKIVAVFYRHQNELTTHLQYPEIPIPHTSNDIENLFKQLRLRLRSLGSFREFKHARHYLKAWALWRRCTPFTDCRGARKTRNGRLPLQIACRTKLVDIDFLSL